MGLEHCFLSRSRRLGKVNVLICVLMCACTPEMHVPRIASSHRVSDGSGIAAEGDTVGVGAFHRSTYRGR